MRLISELLSTDVGLMSAAGLLFMLGMGAFFLRYVVKHVHDDEARLGKAKP